MIWAAGECSFSNDVFPTHENTNQTTKNKRIDHPKVKTMEKLGIEPRTFST